MLLLWAGAPWYERASHGQAELTHSQSAPFELDQQSL
jgi:hypothetical protein